MATEWIVVTSRDQARIFARQGTSAPTLICELGNPNGVAKPQDLESDRPGRSTDNRMHARHAYSTEESATDRSLRNFYREVSDRLDKACYSNEYTALTLVAEPRLLGIIRPLLSSRVRKAVRREIPKDLSFVSESNISERL